MAELLGQSLSSRNEEIQNEDHHTYEGGHQNSVWTDDKDDGNEEGELRCYVSFRDRTEREQAQMQIAAPFIFRKFMKYSKITYQWGDEESWNRDWKVNCKCNTAKRERTIDIVYITSQIPILLDNQAPRQLDSVQLVQMGLIGSTAKNPVTTFSIRLLRLHHLLWKLCCVQISPFCLAIDEYLDARNPIITSADGVRVNQASKLHSISSAVNVFCKMLRLEAELKKKALKLTSLQQLAANCPCCFGPRVEGKREAKPDFIVCMDGNFQHRRHKAASATWREI
ncbi:uncharacterized protein MELLADRAFT_84103 [Melampsora larici-populina 98AG31]|uniref:CxC1-like cysteine cluster associated with KDZ transposases domain-containing protein n=1 Tax=Melampsora larici-populina (strain 98AG31 / pathotype 3-4-7) TaxID=747676 RepID=F4SBI2_MELLP|nr:uncharacterized protein MELLADRAFT_84103 [Melampsora larici-populina 98AG31]EGF97999.1 hypothetical protein MELLADRAFT_84103 [Melampsora larici-populina 98AG31]